MEKVSIGKNTLGGGKKMEVALHGYNRSTHDLSHAWRSSAGVGTLIPCLKLVALPGDTFDINIDTKVLTHPTVGPLFGSYKYQIDIFSCPIRLYNAKMHNNALNVGLDMSKVILPKLNIKCNKNKPTKFSQSSLLAYLGYRGQATTESGERKINAVPYLAYLDIFKNYYANKQEDTAYYISRYTEEGTVNNTNLVLKDDYIIGGAVSANFSIYGTSVKDNNFTIVLESTEKVQYVMNRDLWKYYFECNIFSLLATFTVKNKVPFKGIVKKIIYNEPSRLIDFPLVELDNLRENILAAPTTSELVISNEWSKIIKAITDATNVGNTSLNASGGLLIKTHQSDIFNNWVKKEWVEGDNGINKITAVDTSSGSFTLDTLNLAKKVYNMLNRIAVSGGTYRDWIETVYDIDFSIHTETPVYEGGYSNEIEFQEVVSNSASLIGDESEPLGTLAGRGMSTNREKGGSLHIKVKEPSYIIGILSITPRTDYCQGNDWDINQLKTIDDLHKPQLDGIGWQDLLGESMMWWKDETVAYGKQPAWINYMTAVNKTYGTFAERNNEDFMVLNKWFDESKTSENKRGGITSYINPTDFNNIFADTNQESQNFWVQIGFGIKARRVMSAKQIPLM